MISLSGGPAKVYLDGEPWVSRLNPGRVRKKRESGRHAGGRKTENIETLPGITISNELCVVMGEEGLVAIADLHVGMESGLEREGFHIPRMQTATMRDSIQRIVDRFSPDRIVVVGDLKHEFSRNLEQEWNEVRSLLSFLRENAEVSLVRGNHDNYLRTIASRLGIEMGEFYSAGKVTFAHGHLDNSSRPLVIGHEHPSIKIIDRVGASIKLPCFVHLKKEGILVMPAFSPLAAGVDMARIESSECLSPILRGRDLRRAEIFACSEVGLLGLGSIGDIGSFSI